MSSRSRLAWLAAIGLLAPNPLASERGAVLGDVASAANQVQESTPVEAAALEAQVREVASRLRCPVCRSLSIYDSPSEMALQMRALIRDKLRSGSTPEEVVAYFVDRYGEWVLLEPKATGLNWTVWLLPVLVVAGGLTFVFLTARRWVEQGKARAAALMEGREGET